MAVTVACPSCERKFQAPPQFVGKRVKCKGCGEIFAIPGPQYSTEVAEVNVDDPLNELAKTSQGIGNVGRFTATGNAQQVTPESQAKANLTPNVLTFNYPRAGDVDRWLSSILIVLCGLMLGDTVAGVETHDVVWIAITRFITVIVLYSMVIFPLTLMMIKKASREAKYDLPPQPQLRCFAAYMPAILIATWLLGLGGAVVIEIFGSILGIGISSVVLWLLFRLREQDIVSFCVQGAGGFLGGMFASIVLILLLNTTAAMMVSDAKALRSVPASPFAAGLTWASPTAVPDRPKAPISISAPETATASGVPVASAGGAKSAGTEPAVTTSSSLVDHVESGKITGVIDGIIEPLSSSPMFAVLRTGQGGISIESWNNQTWVMSPGTLQLPTGAAKKFVLSTDGQKIAWIAEFPRLSVQVWSFADAKVSATIPLNKLQGGAEMIGFVDVDKLLLERGNASPEASASRTNADAPAAATAEPDAHAVFDGFRMNPNEITREHAVDNAPKPPAPAANAQATPARPEDLVPAHAMQIIDTTASKAVCDFNLPALVTDYVPSGPSTNVFKAPLHLGTNITLSTTAHRIAAAASSQDSPTLAQFDLLTGKKLPGIKIGEIDPSLSGSMTGLAYSNDGTKLASFFDHNDSALLLSYDVNSGAKLAENVYPDGPLEGAPHSQIEAGAMVWLDPAPYWLFYGQGFINSKTGVHLKSADLGLGTIITQRVLDAHRIQLLSIDNGARRVDVVELNAAANDAEAKP